ncbi:hypothetical protein M422DRAFT_271058 [Sphaerobolus stellatus SS14]|uniref:Uncharacterized protein n=1 Tax=Sphaerobolus stellatus (strain SS14) TaxID=990650 RepID=A0A0C9UFA7_SPHS4|nr:hypothetical protein M422DRAFT_271058 [Sphaerobolus stellatus SS14]
MELFSVERLKNRKPSDTWEDEIKAATAEWAAKMRSRWAFCGKHLDLLELNLQRMAGPGPEPKPTIVDQHFLDCLYWGAFPEDEVDFDDDVVHRRHRRHPELGCNDLLPKDHQVSQSRRCCIKQVPRQSTTPKSQEAGSPFTLTARDAAQDGILKLKPCQSDQAAAIGKQQQHTAVANCLVHALAFEFGSAANRVRDEEDKGGDGDGYGCTGFLYTMRAGYLGE